MCPRTPRCPVAAGTRGGEPVWGHRAALGVVSGSTGSEQRGWQEAVLLGSGRLRA